MRLKNKKIYITILTLFIAILLVTSTVFAKGSSIGGSFKSGSFSSKSSFSAPKASSVPKSSTSFKSSTFSNTKPSTSTATKAPAIKSTTPAQTKPVNTPPATNITVNKHYYNDSNSGSSDHFWSGFMMGHIFSGHNTQPTTVISHEAVAGESHTGSIIGTIIVITIIVGLVWYLYKKYKR